MAGCSHDHATEANAGEVAALLQRAQQQTVEHGRQWTEPRRRVYELLLQANGPVKAYDLMDAYAENRATKPPTVYRALEYLEELGLVHRIASLNAYVACDVAGEVQHAAAFMICDCCGAAHEFQPGRVESAARIATERRFSVRALSVEVRGLCAACA